MFKYDLFSPISKWRPICDVSVSSLSRFSASRLTKYLYLFEVYALVFAINIIGI